MIKNDKIAETTIKRISPVYDKVFLPKGDGFAGFTIYFSEESFTNHIQYFDRDTRSQVTEQVIAIHERYIKACQRIEENLRNPNAKGIGL